MPGKRSVEALERRPTTSSLLFHVRRREAALAVREASVARREVAAPDVNRQAVAVASEAAAAMAMATRVAAAHLVYNVEEHFEDLEANAAIGASRAPTLPE